MTVTMTIIGNQAADTTAVTVIVKKKQ